MHSRIIVALDGMTYDQAVPIMRDLHNEVALFKVGQEMITRGEAGKVSAYLRQHNGRGVFWDGKFHDIPQTVYNSSMTLEREARVLLFNVHCLGGMEMMQAAAKAAHSINLQRRHQSDDEIKTLGVTILTSMNESSLAQVGLCQEPSRVHDDGYVARLVCCLAVLAKESGLNGVVASPLEIEVIRKACGDDFLIVTPGVRPAGSTQDDQKRVMTPGDAIKAGANYLVVGRPITQPASGTILDAARRINDEIAQALA